MWPYCRWSIESSCRSKVIPSATYCSPFSSLLFETVTRNCAVTPGLLCSYSLFISSVNRSFASSNQLVIRIVQGLMVYASYPCSQSCSPHLTGRGFSLTQLLEIVVTLSFFYMFLLFFRLLFEFLLFSYLI